MDKIIRTVCLFVKENKEENIGKLEKIVEFLKYKNFIVQTKSICLPRYMPDIDDRELLNRNILLGFGKMSWRDIENHLDNFILSSNKNITLNLSSENIEARYVKFLSRIIAKNPDNTFNFAYGFNLPVYSPYFPSASYGDEDGFSIGLQPTDMAEECKTIDCWLCEMRDVWREINRNILPDCRVRFGFKFLGIDTSIAPLFSGKSSFVNFIKRMQGDFNSSVLTNTYVKISNFIKRVYFNSSNPGTGDSRFTPIGLSGLMFPCLEDFELAEEYEKGNFSIERNLFLSLHSGTGIDTYPVGYR